MSTLDPFHLKDRDQAPLHLLLPVSEQELLVLMAEAATEAFK